MDKDILIIANFLDLLSYMGCIGMTEISYFEMMGYIDRLKLSENLSDPQSSRLRPEVPGVEHE